MAARKTPVIHPRIELTVFGYIKEIDGLSVAPPVALMKCCTIWVGDTDYFNPKTIDKESIKLKNINATIMAKDKQNKDIFTINNYGIQNIDGSNCDFDYKYQFEIKKMGKIRIGLTTETGIKDWNDTLKYWSIEIQGREISHSVPIVYWSQNDHKYHEIMSIPKDKKIFIQMVIEDNKLYFRLPAKNSYLSLHECNIKRENKSWHLFVNIDNKAIVKLQKFMKTKRT